MNLIEWKKYQTLTMREELKSQMKDGFDFTNHFLFSEDALEEMRQEALIESFDEVVEFDDEFEIDVPLIEKHTEVQEVFDFAPDQDGSVMDLVFEFDLSVMDPSVKSLTALKELLFAEDYEMEIIHSDKDDETVTEDRAKVIFKRSKGEIKKKKICGPGMRLAGNRCIPQTGTQKAKERRKGIKLKRAKKAMGSGKKKKAALRGRITKRRVKGRSRALGNTIN